MVLNVPFVDILWKVMALGSGAGPRAHHRVLPHDLDRQYGECCVEDALKQLRIAVADWRPIICPLHDERFTVFSVGVSNARGQALEYCV